MYSLGKRDNNKQEKYRLRDVAVIETLFATGARVSEVSNIRMESVNLDTGLIRIMEKGGKERYLQIGSPDILDVLKKYYDQNVVEIKKSGYFFVNSRGCRYTEQSIRLMLKKYTKLAGIERNITPHMFRHSFATYLWDTCGDVYEVKEILGHSSIRTTERYVHASFERQKSYFQLCIQGKISK